MFRQETLQMYDNSGNILALVRLCGNEVYVYPRLKVGVYALSEGGKIEQNGLTPVFSYSFPDLSWDGPYDFKFEADLDALWMGGHRLIRSHVQKEGCELEHSLYKLTEQGFETALIAEAHLTKDQLASLKRVAEDLREDKNSLTRLLSKYAREWDKQAAERIKK